MDDILDEQNCTEKINSYTKDRWQPLFALIPEIEKTSVFRKRASEDKNGSIQIPFWESAPIVKKFLEVVYAIPIIISFDWASWDEGRKMLNDKNFDFDSVDLVTKCKLITAIVRNDRFCEEALADAFEPGLILKILKSMEREVNSKK